MPDKLWKALEREAAQALGGSRIYRGADYSKSDVDVDIPDFPNLLVDCKLRDGNMSHHTFLNIIVEKYCKKPTDIPVLVSKRKGVGQILVTIPIEHYAALLNVVRLARRKQIPNDV